MFKRYACPDSVGWLGCFVHNGRVTAFVGLDRRVVFVRDIKGWDMDFEDWSTDGDE